MQSVLDLAMSSPRRSIPSYRTPPSNSMFRDFIVIKHLIFAAVAAASAAIVSPAFASGYGPAPHYDALAGAPASQRGQSALTVRAEQVEHMASADITGHSYGGMRDMTSQSSAHVVPDLSILPYSHH